ncbi:sigma-70 family RNA polymerase sigma factor [Clavibacter michiganensis]|uniref:sigma-70 family RNA polymerase sigma factor n=1 Tax=Clavibacter michiganensis TaxID=28447 RepID=UPI0015E23850|nr:sigma-70 family RNA polymerase sigma factor [Clavibacter michiganensis]
MNQTDTELIAAVREGDRRAAGILWARHAPAASRMARVRVGWSEAEDIVAEAFARILSTLRSGAGPVELFRPYLYAVVKNLIVRERRRRSRLCDEGTDFEQFESDDPVIDPAARLSDQDDRRVLGRALDSLPKRWQAVLCYLEVEGMRPREVAELVGLNAGAVSSLAYRARRALRAAWVQQHVDPRTSPAACRPTLSSLGSYVAGTLSPAGRHRLEQHVLSCVSCPRVLADARRASGEFGGSLRLDVDAVATTTLVGGAPEERVAVSPLPRPTGALRAYSAVPPERSLRRAG